MQNKGSRDHQQPLVVLIGSGNLFVFHMLRLVLIRIVEIDKIIFYPGK